MVRLDRPSDAGGTGVVARGTYGRALNQAVWREIGDVEVNEHLEEHKIAFMAAARASLASP